MATNRAQVVTSPRASLARAPSRSVASPVSEFVVALRSPTRNHQWRSMKSFQFDEEKESPWPSRRQRFHSTDVVFQSTRVAMTKLSTLDNRGDHGWNFQVHRFQACCRHTNPLGDQADEPEPPLADPAERAQWALSRRTCSENFTINSRAPSSLFDPKTPLPFHPVGLGVKGDRVEEGTHETNQERKKEAWNDGLVSESGSSRRTQHGFQTHMASKGQNLEKLCNLQKLYHAGFMTVTEYEARRRQLVDARDHSIAKTSDLLAWDVPILYREPPEFSLLRVHHAIKHTFDSDQCKWTSSRIQVKIDTEPFGSGGLRQVFHLQDVSRPVRDPDKGPSFVAKIAIDPHEHPDTYFKDVEMQAVAAKYATLYNSYHPPRRVEFLDAWILQWIPAHVTEARDPRLASLTLSGTLCGVEPFIAGEFHKHNNNFGYVSDLERNTPQAFSHFTYEASGHAILVVDIQGVGDHYTDPQIHTRRGKEFGKGNLAMRGIERFLGSHRCNPICRYLKLPLINPKDHKSQVVDRMGTIPAQTYMSQPRVVVDRVDAVLCHYYGNSVVFQQYLARKTRHRTQKQAPRRRQPHGRKKASAEPGVSACASAVAMQDARDRFVTALVDQQRSCSTLLCDGVAQCLVS